MEEGEVCFIEDNEFTRFTSHNDGGGWELASQVSNILGSTCHCIIQEEVGRSKEPEF